MSYTEMARDVLAFMDKVAEQNEGSEHFSKAVIVGHSMGGKVAQSLALMHPERVAGLVVIDIAPVKYSSEETGDGSAWKLVEEIVRSVAKLDLESGRYKTKRDVDAAMREILPDPALRAFVLTNLEQIRSDSGDIAPLKWKINWDGIVSELDRIAGFDAHDTILDDAESEALSSFKYEGDTFYIHGGASRFVRSSHISTIANFFPNHMLTTIRGVGHWVHAEAPDDTIALLKQYLDR
jgi:esterase